MKYRALLTTLFEEVESRRMAYYGSVENAPRLYCDAPLAVEACVKYILARHPIDEIIAIGESDEVDESGQALSIKDGRALYGSDVTQLSNFDLLRYRLAQHLDEKREDSKLLDNLLDESERSATRDIIQDFYQSHHADDERLDRFFDILARDKDLQGELFQALEAGLPQFNDKRGAYVAWAKQYLYSKLKSTRKIELLDDNHEVKVSYVSAKGIQAETNLVEKLGAKIRAIAAEADEPVELELYLCIHNEDAFDSHLIINLIDLAKMMPELSLSVAQAVTTRKRTAFVITISDVTAFYGTSELLASTKAFLRYGKTDLLTKYWERQGSDNPYISRVIDALRVIDVGISLCDIGDIERGITNLRKVLSEPYTQVGDTPIEKYFPILIESIKRDMGSMLEETDSSFINLVKWTYQKGLYQQVLTLVESRAPQDIVNRGIFYYCDSDESEAQALKVLGQVYYDLRPFEKYRLDDISHFFVKSYGREKIGRTKSKDELERRYAQLRIDDLDTEKENVIKALTRCSDRDALKDLLYAYYHTSDVRNATNHGETSDEILLREESDVSVRLKMIDQALRFFIKSYERVDAALEPSEEPVRKLTTADLFAFSRTLRPERSRPNNHNREQSEGNAENKPAEQQTEG